MIGEKQRLTWIRQGDERFLVRDPKCISAGCLTLGFHRMDARDVAVLLGNASVGAKPTDRPLYCRFPCCVIRARAGKCPEDVEYTNQLYESRRQAGMKLSRG
jgi:hypothetical protein